MHCRTCFVLLFCAVSLLPSRSASGQQWTRFRGPNGGGECDASTIPTTWTSEDYNWRVELPGIGHSSPVIWGDRVFVTCADEEDATRIVRCLDTSDGSLIWEQSFESTTYKKHQFNSYAAATPAVDKDHVYVSWSTPQQYTLVALDRAKGEVVWRRNLEPYKGQHGSGASPILFEEMLIVPNDQPENSSAIALERMTGETRWRTELPIRKGGYATPCIYRPTGGEPQLILSGSAYGLHSLDPRTGEKIWQMSLFKDRVVCSPMIASGLIIVGSGEGGRGTRMVAVRPGDPGQGVEPEVVYEMKAPMPYVCTPVVYGDLLFLWFDLGVVTCLDAPTGEIHWQERIGGNYFGSPVRVADRIYCISRKGEMVVLAAADEYELLARVDLEERSNSTPAIADGVMYLRTASHLMALGGKETGPCSSSGSTSAGPLPIALGRAPTANCCATKSSVPE